MSKCRKKSVLNKQKYKTKLSLKVFFISLCTLFLVMFVYYGFNYISEKKIDSVASYNSKNISYSFSYELVNSTRKTKKIFNKNKKNITNLINNYKKQMFLKNYNFVLRQVLKLGLFKSVSMVSAIKNNFHLRFALHSPLLCVKVKNKLHWVSESSIVYGSPQQKLCPKPIANNIVSYVENQKILDNSILVLDKDNKVLIQSLVKIYKYVKEYNVENILYKKNRGFVVQIKNDATTSELIDVYIGETEFDKIFVKLKKVLRKIYKGKKIARKIELDYKGKAFILFKKEVKQLKERNL